MLSMPWTFSAVLYLKSAQTCHKIYGPLFLSAGWAPSSRDPCSTPDRSAWGFTSSLLKLAIFISNDVPFVVDSGLFLFCIRGRRSLHAFSTKLSKPNSVLASATGIFFWESLTEPVLDLDFILYKNLYLPLYFRSCINNPKLFLLFFTRKYQPWPNERQ